MSASGVQCVEAGIDRACDAVLRHPPRHWWWAFLAAGASVVAFIIAVGKLLFVGVGIWGINIPVAWGFAIANYIWWIGIGMAGTFISAALHLLRLEWRPPIVRYSETMTVFAVSVSGLFPIFHLGRPWFFYWLAPYPNKMSLWPQWRSSLLWDFFAILAYLLISLIFWYVSMLPDLATLRDRAQTLGKQRFYGLLALGWRGEARQWQNFELLTTVLAGIAVPLVFSVHSMVGLDLSEGWLAGWHSSLFPPFFVAGALYSGFGLALVLGIVVREWLGLQAQISVDVLDRLGRVLLAAGLFMAYCYGVEMAIPFYSCDRHELNLAHARLSGNYSFLYWTTISLNLLPVQALWFSGVRRRPWALALVGGLVVVGMWFERVMLLVTTLAKALLPSMSGHYVPTSWDWLTLFGSIGLFIFLFLLFLRLLPAISLVDLRRSAKESS
jgi:molybdopterin-containing oxidoreductase family membrane subunit